MTRTELVQQIVTRLHQLTDIELRDLLLRLEQREAEVTDANLSVITYGADETEHLLSSAKNSEILHQALEELKGKESLLGEANEYVA
ncbi:MAG: hypothetical protein ACPGVO_13715 [Spirulinaceae cyanobacterium]